MNTGGLAMRSSLRLPTTAFPMRANAARREPAAIPRLTTELYQRQWAARVQDTDPASPQVFVLHDGPPYANGSLHMGHAMNKVLKDVVNRYQLLQGRGVWYVPGWDCHGLPIELKALQDPPADGSPPPTTPLAVRGAARAWAQSAMTQQQADFARWTVMADWSRAAAAYRTMDPAYEAEELRVLQRMVVDGHVFRSLKPVYWSPSSRTALAEAELEYMDDHISQAAFVAFPVATPATASPVARQLAAANTSAVIWTTTPWTIPANVAVCVRPDMEYAVVAFPNRDPDRSFLVSTSRVAELQRVFGDGDAVVTHFTVSGTELLGLGFHHPTADRVAPVLAGDHVTDDSGTGVVHTAPGHGVEDFEVCQHADPSLPVLCPVDDTGCFTDAVGPHLAGLPVLTDGNAAVLEQLRVSGALLHSEPHAHRYPYDWRTKQPVIFRATRQWFARVDGVLPTAQAALGDVAMTPPVSRNRLQAMLGGRRQWCISRQRAWGVPIPVFYHVDT